MRENRSYGSEGGAAQINEPSLPLSEEHHGGIKAKSADAECFSEPREVPVLRPKWASSSPSQGHSALELTPQKSS